MNTIYKVFACTICLGLSLNIQLMAEETSAVDAKEKPWITDSPSESVEKLNKEVQKHPERHETYEQVNMSKIEMFSEDYVGRRFVFDKCYVEPEFKEPSTLGIPKEKYFAFTIKPVSSSKKYKNFGDVIFIVKKSFARQWADKIGDGNFTWPWSVVSGTMQKFGWKWKISNDIQWHYAFVIDEFVVCNTKTGEPIDSLFFCEVPVSDKHSSETKSFIVFSARLGRGLNEKKAPSGEAIRLYAQGMAHWYGRGALPDKNRAFELFSEAYRLGVPEPAGLLARCYLYGIGCEVDKTKAYQLALEAESSTSYSDDTFRRIGVEFAKTCLGFLWLVGFTDTEGHRHLDYPTAYKYFQDTTDRTALTRRGLMEYYGVGTPRNLNRAAETFYSICKDMPEGDDEAGEAALCLGQLYFLGEGVHKSEKEAFKWLRYGARTAFPRLVKEAKKPLTSDDYANFKNLGGTIVLTPFSYKMSGYIYGKYSAVWNGKTIDLLEKALLTYFSPQLWSSVTYGPDDM